MERHELHVGQEVHYTPSHGLKENGIVKSITEHGVFVVYNCAENWHRIKDYTAANTDPSDLRPGWVADARNANQ